jgi:hypothetical protein
MQFCFVFIFIKTTKQKREYNHVTISLKISSMNAVRQLNNNLNIYTLVWLDTSINTQRKLQSFANRVLIFVEVDQCEQYIHSVSPSDRLILIVSDDLSQQLIPRIHQFQQIDSIYIYCLNKQFDQQWTQEYIKVTTNNLFAIII